MNYNQEYMSGTAALKGFLEKFFIVFTVGILFVFVLLRSEVMADVSPKSETVRQQTKEIAVTQTHASASGEQIDFWLGRRLNTTPGRGQGDDN